MSDLADRTILFHRDFGGLTGGHLKVWDYYRHATHSRRYRPRIYLTPESVRDAGNPWLSGPSPPLTAWRPAAADVLFLAGLDWEAVPEPVAMPVINLVQGVRHADRGDPRRAFLVRPAIRICVSDEVADAIGGTGLVNGPVHVIPNGIDLDDLPPPAAVRDTPVLVAGAKNPAFATAVAERLGVAGVRAECLLAGLPRPAFLARLARAQVAVTLPLDREGFFLPALEAMAVGAIVVCPDCVGNRGFCRDGETAFRPKYTLEAVTSAVLEAVGLDGRAADSLRRTAAAEVLRHGIDRERSAFLRILDAV